MTNRIRLLVLTAAALGVLGTPTTVFAQTPTKLVANVGLNDAFTISLRTATGDSVNNIPAGNYEIEVHDHSSMHNFHLSGPGGVNRATTESFVGTETWMVTLQDGRYTFLCDPHPTQMRGSFTVGIPTPAPPPPPPAPAATRLIATVGPGATISLRTVRGRRITRLKAGRYRITVRDRSAMHNFHLSGPGVNKRTTVKFRGTTTWTLRFRKGLYRFVCDPHKARMKGSFRVT